MAKKIVELSTKRKVELKEMSIDDIDLCNDITVLKSSEDGKPYITGMSKSRTAWLRRGIVGGDFKAFKLENELVVDKVLKQLSEEEKNDVEVRVKKHIDDGNNHINFKKHKALLTEIITFKNPYK